MRPIASKHLWKLPCTSVLGLLCLLPSGCGSAAPGLSPQQVLALAGCDPSKAIETDGYRRLALIVGVGEYQNSKIPDLKGPPNDAQRMYDLFTDVKNGYGFPKENVCLLLNEAATTEGFRQAFEKSLVGRIKSVQDVAVFYFAGHGSQARDRNGDEPDGLDETMILNDSRTGKLKDFLDDDFNALLTQLHRKTTRATVILDSCNSGTATRAADASTAVARFFKPADDDEAPRLGTEPTGDGAGGWAPESLPGMVVLTAASDSNAALEMGGRGIFTDALISVLSQVGDHPLTYAQVARQAPPLIAARSPQIPYFQGDLSDPVFGNVSRKQPLAWEVVKVGPPMELGGPPLPGIDVGAEFRIYDGSVEGADTRDPGKAKATAVLTEMTGLNGKAVLSASMPGAPDITPGDLAVLARPGDSAIRLNVRLKPASEPGGLAAARAKSMRDLVAADPEASLLIELTDGPGDFELSVGTDGRLLLRGPENRTRNIYDRDEQVPRSLWQHARQRGLLALRGEGGGDFEDNRTLLARLVPAPASKQSKCADGVWEQAKPNEVQMVPLCHAFNLEVKLSESAPVPLLVGALTLSTDGSVYALPSDDRKVRLQPGETATFNGKDETFQGQPPLDVRDTIIVFGTQETNPVQWSRFTETAQTRSATAARGTGSALYNALDRYFKPGTRGIGKADEGPVENTTWTLSTVGLRVLANSNFLKVDPGSETPIDKREYTIASFDIRPYLPDDPDSALYKVLAKADWLANQSATDGYSYKQHDWSLGSDQANLERGIDCSRAIWFAFTRVGLSYNRDNRYLTTAEMVGSGTRMQDDFQSCSGEANLQTGDVLVYRDDTHHDGHVVMVIDPERRIAWGSHGWDGSPRVLPVEPDTGVEYQKIMYKPDWRRWDRSTMERKACWRYRVFAEEARTGRSVPGLRALASACDKNKRCGLR